MTTFYFVALTNPDDTPSDIDVGGAGTENGAAKVALAQANRMKRDTCVVALNSATGAKVVKQIIRYVEGGAIAPPHIVEAHREVYESMFDREYLRKVSLLDPATLDWIHRRVVGLGYTVTIEFHSPSSVDVTASKKR